MPSGMTESLAVARINAQTASAYLHVPTNKKYSVCLEAGGVVELEPINGPHIYVRLDRLADANIWQRIN
ncbi:hypothetical protein [Pseudomonas nitroreducens]|uniref:hypothetical protein n=2 Tax=Pseudomonas TaxID=286 RepID=UPI00351D99F5